jgi:hypothetical protein
LLDCPPDLFFGPLHVFEKKLHYLFVVPPHSDIQRGFFVIVMDVAQDVRVCLLPKQEGHNSKVAIPASQI